jgi:hypothetical protein
MQSIGLKTGTKTTSNKNNKLLLKLEGSTKFSKISKLKLDVFLPKLRTLDNIDTC